MTHTLVYLSGILLLLCGTVRAVQHRHHYPRCILWGALADAGLLCMGLSTPGALATLGVLLCAVVQFSARLLALSAIAALLPQPVRGIKNICSLFKDATVAPAILHTAGVRQPVAGTLLALGLLACVGGSPFLLPEGRVFVTQALIAPLTGGVGGHWGGLTGLILAALCAACFVWLHVSIVRHICLDKAHNTTPENTPRADVPKLPIILGSIIALLGLMRVPITDAFAWLVGIHISHASMHPAYLVLYWGAFVTAGLGWRLPVVRDYTVLVLTATAFVCALLTDTGSPAGTLFTILITGIGFVVSLYSIGYMTHGHGVTRYYFFLLLTFASLVGIVTSTDIGAFYGFWELMTFASYFLVVHEGTRVAFNAGLKYYTMCAAGAFVMLPGLFLLSAGNNTFAAIPTGALLLNPAYLQAALVLALMGFAVKAGLVPLHSWLPDAHPAAPSSVSGPLSGVITKMGIFGIVVVLLGFAGKASASLPSQSGLSWIGYGITFMGGLTLIYGELMALKQNDIKRMLAFSTLGQLGEVTLVLGLGTWLATTGALAHVVNHAVMKDVLFLGAGALILRTGSRTLSDLAGMGRAMPWTVGCMVVGLISIMGLPPFAAFLSKYLMIQAAIDAGYPILSVLILAGSLVGAVYYTRILRTLVFEERPAHLPVITTEAPWSIRLALGILAGTSLVFGLAPQWMLSLVTPVASAFMVPAGNAFHILESVTVQWPVFVIVPMLGAILPVLFRKNRITAGWVTVGVLLLSFLLVVLFGQGLDTLSFAFACLVPLIGALNIAYAVGYMEHSHSQWRFYAAFCCMCGGLMGVASAKHLFSFFVFWEIMSSWSLYMAIAHEGTADSLREAFKYFFFNILGAAFLFVGVTLIGPHFPLSADMVWREAPALSEWTAHAGMVLLAIGFVMKAAQLPFRIDWQMHPALAPTPVSGYISSVLLKSAIVGLVKLFMLLGGAFILAGAIQPSQARFIQTLVMWVGGVTIIMASIQALVSSNLKLIFIYSTVSQIGYMVLAVGVGSALGYAGGLLHVANHVFFKDLLFLICGAVMLQTHKDSLDDLGGIGRKMPFTLTMFAIAGLSVVGVPPTSGFTSKWLIYHALMAAGQPLLALLSLIGSVITLAYIAKFLHAAFMGQPGEHLEHVTEAPKIMRIPMLILGIGCVVTGVFPGIFLYPINSILAEYGMKGLDVGLSGVLSGSGAWNATGMAVMMSVAFYIGWKFVRHFVDQRWRTTDVHTCGLEPHIATSRMQPSSIYAGFIGILMGLPKNTHKN